MADEPQQATTSHEPTQEDCAPMTPEHVLRHRLDKDIQFFAALMNAWVTTKMEVDRQLLTMSVGLLGGIAFAVTQLPLDTFQFAQLVAAALSVGASIHYLIAVLDHNAVYVESAAQRSAAAIKHGSDLKGMDRKARFAFYFGVLMAMLVALQIGAAKTKQAEREHERREEAIERAVSGEGDRGQERQSWRNQLGEPEWRRNPHAGTVRDSRNGSAWPAHDHDAGDPCECSSCPAPGASTGTTQRPQEVTR